MKQSHKQLQLQPGFTVVELLIVVVVIAILATVVIVSYRGIQTNAKNSQVIAGVSQYRELIESYRSMYGRYPKTTREIANEKVAVVCVGSGYTGGYCGKVSGTDVYEDPYFVAEIKKAGYGPPIAFDALGVGSEQFTGAVYGIDITATSQSPTGYGRTIQYALRGNSVDCGIEGAWGYAMQSEPPMTACEILLEQVPAR